MPDLSAQMDAVCHRFEELSVRLNQPDAAADPALFRKLMRDYHETQPVVQAYRDWQTARDHLAQAKALLEEPISDPDFKQMIQQEISEKSQDVAKLEAPQGCFLRVRMVSPTAISIALVAPFCRPSEWSAATVRHPDHKPCRTYRYSIMQTPAKCKYLPRRMHIVENGSVLCPAQRRTQKSTEKEE